MKIIHKINIVNVFFIVLITFLAWSAYQGMNLIQTKVRFAEFAESLNLSFLEMRLSEKNYFLYGDESALTSIKKKLDESVQKIDSVKADIIKAIGISKFQQYQAEIGLYRQTLVKVEESQFLNDRTIRDVRDAGTNLRDFSRRITHLEWNLVNEIILYSKNRLIYSFLFILVCAVGFSYFFLFSIMRSLKKIEKLAHSISEGNFQIVEGSKTTDEVGTVIMAINSMSQELWNREEQLLQAKKLESIGILTAGVAHELGNPLNNISMIAQAYVEVYDSLDDTTRMDYMKKIEEETERIKEIVKNLLDFSRPKKPTLKQVDINTVVIKSHKLVQNLFHINNIKSHLDLQPSIPAILTDENQIQEVLINLMTNSGQAMSAGGDLKISTRLDTEKQVAEITIEDNGKGIPNELIPHLFDPFFTTKGSGGVG
ncbi:MAG: HAMP domain-containing protein, partial [SAR324 cluster bacterium]|nr:HAMP domain-containing protein [SAR324 cluster bacterium]